MIMINGEWWKVDSTPEVMRVIREYMPNDFAKRAEEICGDRDELFIENENLVDENWFLKDENETLRSLI